MKPYEEIVEDRDATVIGNLMDIAILRLMQLKDEVLNPEGGTWGIRRYTQHMVEAINSLDSIFFRMNRGQKYPRELTKQFEEVLKLRGELIDEIMQEVQKTSISKERLKELLTRLAGELEIYFKYIDTFMYLRGEFGEEEIVIEEENGEAGEPEEDYEDDEFIDDEYGWDDEEENGWEMQRIREILTPREYDDGLTAHAKEALSDLLTDSNYRNYLFDLARLQMENGDSGEIPESEIRSVEDKTAVARELKRMGVIGSRGRGRRKYVWLNPPYGELMFMVLRELSGNND